MFAIDLTEKREKAPERSKEDEVGYHNKGSSA
jgi:hypothetical protein